MVLAAEGSISPLTHVADTPAERECLLPALSTQKVEKAPPAAPNDPCLRRLNGLPLTSAHHPQQAKESPMRQLWRANHSLLAPTWMRHTSISRPNGRKDISHAQRHRHDPVCGIDHCPCCPGDALSGTTNVARRQFRMAQLQPRMRSLSFSKLSCICTPVRSLPLMVRSGLITPMPAFSKHSCSSFDSLRETSETPWIFVSFMG